MATNLTQNEIVYVRTSGDELEKLDMFKYSFVPLKTIDPCKPLAPELMLFFGLKNGDWIILETINGEFIWVF